MYPNSFTPRKAGLRSAIALVPEITFFEIEPGVFLYVNISTRQTLRKSMGLALYRTIAIFCEYSEIPPDDHLALVDEVIDAIYKVKEKLKDTQVDKGQVCCTAILAKVCAYYSHKYGYEYWEEQVLIPWRKAMKLKQR